MCCSFRKNLIVFSLAIGLAGVSALAGGKPNDSPSRKSDSLTAGLIHWWKFDGNANDSMGELNGRVIGRVSYVDTPAGQGIVLDGVTTGVTFPQTRDMEFQGSYSISAWVCLYAYTTTSIWLTVIFDGDDRPGLDPFFIQVDPHGNLQFQTCGVTRSLGVGGQTPFPLSQFVFVTGTYNKARGLETLYLNGKPVMQAMSAFDLTPVVPLDPGAKPGMGIGTNNCFPDSCSNYGWDGVISSVRVYNRALSTGEVMSLYRSRT